VTNKNQGTGRMGVSKWWCNTVTWLIVGITGLEMPGILFLQAGIELVPKARKKGHFFWGG